MRDHTPSAPQQRQTRAWAKPMRSYRLRGRPLTVAQQESFDRLGEWAFPVAPAAEPVAPIASRHELPETSGEWNTRAAVGGTDDGSDGPIVDLPALFGSDGRFVMEIGFGMAEATIAMASAQPDDRLIAVDVHRPGLSALLKGIADRSLTNVRVAHGDAVEILQRQIAPGALDEIRVYFPDPWPKTGHHRRRLVNAEFVALAARRLGRGGRLHLATDWEHYATVMRGLIDDEPLLTNTADRPDGFVDRPAHRPMTRFEEIGLAKGHAVFDLIAERTIR